MQKIQVEISQMQRLINEAKVTQTQTANISEVRESTIGFEENRELRRKLDVLHNTFNQVAENHRKSQYQINEKPRLSGYGRRHEYTTANARVSTQSHSQQPRHYIGGTKTSFVGATPLDLKMSNTYSGQSMNANGYTVQTNTSGKQQTFVTTEVKQQPYISSQGFTYVGQPPIGFAQQQFNGVPTQFGTTQTYVGPTQTFSTTQNYNGTGLAFGGNQAPFGTQVYSGQTQTFIGQPQVTYL